MCAPKGSISNKDTLDYLKGVEDEWELIPDLLEQCKRGRSLFTDVHNKPFCAGSLKNISFNSPALKMTTERLKTVPSCKTPTLDELKIPINAWYVKCGKDPAQHRYSIHAEACTEKRLLARVRRKFSKDESPRESSPSLPNTYLPELTI